MEKFYLGADIGTNSVGIACTDENYELIRAKGKDCWAVRLFDESKTAETRRNFRTSRRRLERRKQRISWLQALFAPYINDETFFIRLNNSQFLPEDKDEILQADKNALFGDEGYTDKDYHAEFPTIYHLREKLIEGGKYDLKLYYLAIHHIVKYRGHFLFEGATMEEIRDIKRLFENMNAVWEATYAENVPHINLSKSDEAKEILLDTKKGLRDKQIALEKLFGENTALMKESIKAMLGGKISPETLFGEEYKDEKIFSFKDMDEEAFDALQSTYGDNFECLNALRSIYNFVAFEKLLCGHKNISSAMIAVYNKHAADLSLLKSFIRSERPNDYNKIFKSTTEKANYVNYIGYTKKGGEKKKVAKCKSDDEFFAYMKKYLSSLDDIKDGATRDKILGEIENGSFLPKILHSDKGLFPRQVNEAELKAIASNMVKYYPETKEIADKIIPLFEYRIPYFVGPLAGVNSWAVRKSGEITPWNIGEKIDLAASNEEFMRKMTSKCSYIFGEDVLPKCSIIYQKFDVLNQLNKLRVNDRPLTVDLKKGIFNELFLKYPKVSDKKIKDYLIRNGHFSPTDGEISLSGKDGEFKASMSSYIQLKRVLGDFVDKDLKNGGEVCENIILWHTLNTDKKIVYDLIEKRYKNIPEIADSVKALKGLSFKNFGRLSKKFLVDLYSADNETGELVNILDVLYETNENLNEILNDEKYAFGRLVDEANGVADSKITYEDIEKLYVSPAVRRGIWQIVTMIDEYVEAIGRTPDKIFVEVTREDGVKGDAGRTQPRKRQLQEKYKNVSETYADVISELGDEKYSDIKLRQERLFLYFRQLGKCMYSGQKIVLDRLDTDTYDVDHILPRTFIKDDSLDNKVLVLRSKNAEKADRYPLPQGFSDQQDFWKMLLDKNLIAKTTYDRLTRTEPLGDNDYKDFINRQKVITDQTVKAVAELMKRKYPTAKIVYSKAKNVNDFKNKFDIFKCRETNDLHHARDAYLNVVVGNVYDTVFSNPLDMFRKDGDMWRTYNLKKLFTRDVKGAWDCSRIARIKSICGSHTMAVTRYAYCNKGEFYNQTVYGKDDAGVSSPRKSNGPLSDTKKYGGYKSQTTAYFAIVSSLDKKGNRVKTIEAVPVLVAYRLKNNPKAVEEYFNSYLKSPEILVPKIKVKQLISYNGSYAYIAGVSDERIIVHNAAELFTDNKTDEYVNGLLKLADMDAKKMLLGDEPRYVIKTNRNKEEKLVIDKEKNIELYDRLKEKLSDKIYSGFSTISSFAKTMEKCKDKFEELNIAGQAKTLVQILKMFKCNAETPDLNLVGGGTNVGKIRFSKKIDGVKLEIIHLSPAGLRVIKNKV